MSERPRLPLRERIARAKERARATLRGRPRENVDVQSQRKVITYLAHSYRVARALAEWSDLMLHSLTIREKSYAQHLETISHEKKWTPEYNRWLRSRLRELERNRSFWRARLKYAKKLEFRSLNGLRLVRNPSNELQRVIENLRNKKVSAARAEEKWKKWKATLPKGKTSTSSKTKAKEYLEVALAKIQTLRDILKAQESVYLKYNVTFSTRTRTVLKRQIMEFDLILKDIRSRIQAIDNGDEEEGPSHAFV